jgi:hypothetical protein
VVHFDSDTRNVEDVEAAFSRDGSWVASLYSTKHVVADEELDAYIRCKLPLRFQAEVLVPNELKPACPGRPETGHWPVMGQSVAGPWLVSGRPGAPKAPLRRPGVNDESDLRLTSMCA